MPDAIRIYDHDGGEFNFSGSGAAAVIPDDDADLDTMTRALYIGGDGDVAVIMANGGTVTFAGLSAGSLLPVRVSRVLEAGTTATLIVAVW